MVNDLHFHLFAGTAIQEIAQIAVSGVCAQLLDVVFQMFTYFTTNVDYKTVNLAREEVMPNC